MLFLLISLIPVFFIAWIIWLSARQNNQPWLKPFFSHFDFLKEMYSVASIGLLGLFWWTLFTEIIKNYPDNTSTWFLELWILGFIVLIFGLSFYIKSYFGLIGGTISLVIYSATQLIKWSYDNYYFLLKDNLQEINGNKNIVFTASFGIFWVLINLIYFGGKTLANTKIYGRTGNILRALVIFSNLLFLAILSNSNFINYGLHDFLAGNSIIHSWPLLIAALVVIIISGYSFSLSKKINLKSFEIVLSLIPGFVFLIYSFFPLIRFSNDTSLENNPAKIVWAIIFNSLYLSYAIYLINKSDKTHERWLKIYSIILIIGVLIERLVDVAGNFNFSGIYLSLFGGIIMIAVSIIELSKRKNINN